MNNVCGREVSPKYIFIFSIVFLILGFMLITLRPSTQTGLEEVIRKYNTSKDGETLNLHFSGNNILELESCLKRESQELSGKIKKHLSKFKKVMIEIDGLVKRRDGGWKDLFKNIVEQIEPEGLSILSGSLIDEDIKDIVLNKNIEIFRLNGSKITDMDGLFRKEKNTELVEVNISDNELESFPVGLLGVPNLKKLDISRNRGVFSTWDDLMDKEYGSEDDCNDINETDKDKLSGFFDLLSNLTDLNVSDTGLSQVVQMPSLSKLKKLDISWNLLLFSGKKEEDISKFFSKFENLTDLDMHRTGLSHAVPMPSLSKLKKLDISKNLGLFEGKDKGVISQFFSQFPKLTDLNMRKTGLSHAVPIPSLSKLKKLDISSNQDLFISGKKEEDISKFFNQLSNLTDLNISDTELSLSQVVQMPSLSKLKKLDISDNSDLFEGKSEDDISQFFSKFENLTDLNVSDTGLSLSQTVPIPSLSKLEKLDISWNLFLFKNKSKRVISKFFSKFENLTDLDMHRTGLSLSQTVQIPSLSKLKKLDISWNPDLFMFKDEGVICKFFSKFENLTDLDMRDTGLSLSQAVQIPLSKLEKLDISKNSDLFKNKSEEDISQFFSHFKNVKDLDISYNELSGTILIPLKNLKRLDASNNSELTEIKHTEDNPGFFERLEELNVSGCEKLRIGNEFLKRLESLKYLNMMNVLLKGNDKCESLFQESFRKITYGQCLYIKENYAMNFNVLENSYSEIYSLRRLRVLCIEKDKISYPKLFSSRGIKITYFQYNYRKSVEEDREKERIVW